MRGVTGIASCLAIACSSIPAMAGGECLYLGTQSSNGALICQAGVISRCSASKWLPTKKVCKPDTAVPSKVSVQAAPPPLPPPVAAPPPAQPPAPVSLLHVMTASYSAGSVGQDVVFALRDLCDGKASCSLVGDIKFLRGDPAPRQKGRFSIVYECTTGFRSGEVHHVVFEKNATIELGCP